MVKGEPGSNRERGNCVQDVIISKNLKIKQKNL